MNKHTNHISFLKEALANLHLLVSFVLHRKQDEFISKQNIKAIL